MEKKRIWYEKDDEKDPEERKASFDRGMQLPASVRILDVWTKSDGRQVEGIASLWITRQGYMDQTVIHMTDDSDTQSILFSPFLGSIKVVDGYAEPLNNERAGNVGPEGLYLAGGHGGDGHPCHCDDDPFRCAIPEPVPCHRGKIQHERLLAGGY